MAKRVFLIVLDSCGIGEEPDAHEFGDHDCNTMKRISEHPNYKNATMKRLGLANIDGQEYLGPVDHPIGAVARLQEVSRGHEVIVPLLCDPREMHTHTHTQPQCAGRTVDRGIYDPASLSALGFLGTNTVPASLR